ncbi:MAG: methylmalonyl-CoA epimerase [Sphingomonadales bacterium]
MIGELNHVAIVVPDLEAAARKYRETFGAEVSEPVDLPEHGVTTVFVDLANTKIELLHPLGDDSPVQKFLQSHPAGGVHHLCFEVDDLEAAKAKLSKDGIRVLAGGGSGVGAHGKPVIFLHPRDCFGTLIELEEK